MVRVGVKPAIKRWKDHAEIVALGFSLTLKLHDMVHSYLTASQKTSIDAETDKIWQAKVASNLSLLVALVAFDTLRVCRSRVRNLLFYSTTLWLKDGWQWWTDVDNWVLRLNVH